MKIIEKKVKSIDKKPKIDIYKKKPSNRIL